VLFRSPLGAEGEEPVRSTAANGPELSERAQGKLREPGEGVSSKSTATASVQEFHLTRTGLAMGSAPYMSPEQVRADKLDPRTDLFSFGLVLYEMATGHHAFSGETAAVLRDAILNRTPASARESNPELPPELEEIINKALKKDRSLRYQTAAELLADLKELRHHVGSGRGTAVPAPVVGASQSRTQKEHGQDARAPAGETTALHRASALSSRWPLTLAGAALALTAVAGIA